MQALEAFNNSVCHDLNAPVRAMEGFAKAVLEDFSKKLEDEPVLKDYLIRIQKATVRMKNLVRDLMRLAQVSHEDLKATREWFSLTDMALDIVKEEQAYPEHMKHKVVIQPYLMVYGDQALIRLLLHNLLANAFKFSSKKDNPIITVGKANGEFYVRDNGIGFDQQKADLLFRPFSRLHSAADFPGTGIGLTICKRITDIHDGSIRAEGRVDEGATFFFTLGD
jgi:signal transduction histidine kinase